MSNDEIDSIIQFKKIIREEVKQIVPTLIEEYFEGKKDKYFNEEYCENCVNGCFNKEFQGVFCKYAFEIGDEDIRKSIPKIMQAWNPDKEYEKVPCPYYAPLKKETKKPDLDLNTYYYNFLNHEVLRKYSNQIYSCTMLEDPDEENINVEYFFRVNHNIPSKELPVISLNINRELFFKCEKEDNLKFYDKTLISLGRL